MIHLGPVCLPDLKRSFRRKPDAYLLDDPERCVVDLLDLGRSQDLQLQLGIADGFDVLGHVRLRILANAALDNLAVSRRAGRCGKDRYSAPINFLARLTAPIASSE